MLSRGLQSLFTDVPITVLGLLLFLTAHALITTNLLLTRKEKLNQQSRLPLEDQEIGHERR